MNTKTTLYSCHFFLLCSVNAAQADGIVIDKIYHPYVQPQEQEIEWRVLSIDNQPKRSDNTTLHRFAYGRSLSDRWFTEFYLVGRKSSTDDFALEAIELETKWQLTEQGEYSFDWGILFEIENEVNADIWEFTSGILLEKEFGKWSGTANLLLIQEWGDDVNNELETTLGIQARYRYSRAFEPALEFYSGQNTRGLGPVMLGQIRLAGKRQLKWEAGAIFGLDDTSPNRTLRFLVEFEF